MNNFLNKSDDFDLIERFFDFDLSPAELQQFEQRMETDSVFRKRFQLFKEMDTHIEKELGASEALDLIKQQFKVTNPVVGNKEILAKKNSGRIIGVRRWLRIAATIALVIASIVMLRMAFQPIDTNTLAMEHWNQTESITFNNLRSDNTLSTTAEQLIEASALFDNQNYTAVIQNLTDIEPNDAEYPKVALLLGQTYFKQNQLDRANNQFQVVLNHPSNSYRGSALWFQALIQLSKGDKAACIINLNEIIKQDYPLATKAKLLLAQIK